MMSTEHKLIKGINLSKYSLYNIFNFLSWVNF